MQSSRLLSSLLSLSLLACSASTGVIGTADGDLDTVDDTAVPGDDTGGAGGDTEEDTHLWDGATLTVLSPHSGDFLPLGEEARFEAIITSADGDELDFDDIQWSSSIDAGWQLSGALLDDDSLDVGSHTITATAVLPNGDRLVYALGGILVQHEDAGTYVGDVRVDVTLSWSGTDYTLGCTGATTIVVDVYGETATGDSACVLVLGTYDLETTYNFDLSADEGALDGTAEIDLVFFGYDIDMTGDVGGGVLSGSWASTDFGEITGELNATRITRDVGSAR